MGEIAIALTTFLGTQVDHKLKRYKEDLRKISRGAKYLENNQKSTEKNRKDLIDDMRNSMKDAKDESDKFDFASHKGSLTFDWGLFDAYIAHVTYQLMLYMMFINECGKVNIENLEYKQQTWERRLKQQKRRWKNYAIKIAPEAAKQIFWKSYQCEKSGGSLICTDFEGHSMTTSWSSPWSSSLAFASGQLLSNGDVAKCYGSCKKL